MPKGEPWQVAGNAAEVYERELVPAVFGPWARVLSSLPHCGPRTACSRRRLR
jgi:hypothetical protein